MPVQRDTTEGRSGSDDRVKLVDEKDDLPFAGGDFFEHALESLLELAAVLGARDERPQIERQHALACQALGYITRGDSQGDSLDDGGLANARIADEHWIVLRAPRQHLHRPADLVFPSDDRIQIAPAGQLGEIAGVFVERLVRRLGIGAGDPLVAAEVAQRAFDDVARQAQLLEQRTRRGAIELQHREQHVLGRDVLVFEPIGLGRRRVEQVLELAPDVRVSAPHFRHPLERGGEPPPQYARVDTRALDERGDEPALLREQRLQEVQRRDLLVVVLARSRFGGGQRVTRLRGQSIEPHRHHAHPLPISLRISTM